jgi:ring-1,2-phenylacetyl-CoA epoxidase subunit PaaC
LRQLFVDVFNTYYLAELVKSTDETLAAIAAKAIKETQYHLRRSHEWVLRLGDGSEESHRRAQQAVDALWGYTPELFAVDALDQGIDDSGIGVDNASLRESWQSKVGGILSEATLKMPNDSWEVKGGREGYHTENLGHLLNDMQYLHRAYPGLKW